MASAASVMSTPDLRIRKGNGALSKSTGETIVDEHAADARAR